MSDAENKCETVATIMTNAQLAEVRRVRAACDTGKPFLVVTVDDEYFHVINDIIRNTKRMSGQWTAADEDEYRAICSKWGR